MVRTISLNYIDIKMTSRAKQEFELQYKTKYYGTRHHYNISSKGAVLPVGAMTQRLTLLTRYTFWCDTASIMKELIWLRLCRKTIHTWCGKCVFVSTSPVFV